MTKRKGLGKGLDALFLDNQTEDTVVSVLKITDVEPNRGQPRTEFKEEALRELADSIREHGVLQPLVVRPLDGGGYQIVAGERRWRASRMAGLSEVPVVIKELSDEAALQIAIIENLQREDLNPLELALGYRALMEEHGMTQEQVAKSLGKSRPVVANTVRLLGLPEEVQQYLREGKLSSGHARALLALEDEVQILEAAHRAAGGRMLVRDIERMAREGKRTSKPKEDKPEREASPIWGDSFHREMEMALSAELGRRVTIRSEGKKSTLILEFYSDAELADIAARLAKNNND